MVDREEQRRKADASDKYPLKPLNCFPQGQFTHAFSFHFLFNTHFNWTVLSLIIFILQILSILFFTHTKCLTTSQKIITLLFYFIISQNFSQELLTQNLNKIVKKTKCQISSLTGLKLGLFCIFFLWEIISFSSWKLL